MKAIEKFERLAGNSGDGAKIVAKNNDVYILRFPALHTGRNKDKPCVDFFENGSWDITDILTPSHALKQISKSNISGA